MRFCKKLVKVYANSRKNLIDIADECGFSVSSVKNWRNGSAAPSLFATKCLADALGMTISELLEDVDEI